MTPTNHVPPPRPFTVPYHPLTIDYVSRLLVYIRDLEGYYASEHETPAVDRAECIRDLRKRRGMTFLLGDPDDNHD